MALEEGKVKIEKFDGRDLSFWKMQIKDYLYQKKLYQPLSGDKPDDMKQEEWNLLDRQALGVIKLTLTKNVAFNIVNEKTTAGLMKALSNMYEKPSAANKIKFEDEVKALILLSSLPNSQAATIIAISSSTRENTLKLSDICDLILSE
ncbi:Retrovirus-related Pol polyprotein from transposon TNT 1-94, partial [Glycine soja]